ncbi:MAG: ATP-binding protein [Bacillota bacterium]
MILRSIFGKLWLSIVLLVIVTLLVLGIWLSQFFENFYYNQKAQAMLWDGHRIAGLLVADSGSQLIQSEIELLSSFVDGDVMIIDSKGLIRACGKNMGMSPGMHLDPLDTEQVLNGETVIRRGFHQGFNISVLSVAVPITDGQNISGAVMIYAPVAPIAESLDSVRRLIFIGAGAAVLLATVLSLFVSKRISRPLSQMTQVAMAMARGNFTGKVEVRSDDEVGTLGKTLNFLSGELASNLESLSEEKDKLGNVVTSMTDGVITFDAMGNVILANPSVQRWLGEQVKPGQLLDSRQPVVKLHELFETVLRTKVSCHEEVLLGEQVFAVRMAPLRRTSGEIGGVVALLQDVTREKKLEQLRREFLASVSHELRTPLSFIQGYAEALQDDLAGTAEERSEYVSIILDECLRLRLLVNDLMDLTQIEVGQLSLRIEPFQLGDLVKRVVKKYQPMAEEKKIILNCALPEDLPLFNGDEQRVEQVLVNLLDNALRHTPVTGSISVDVSATDTEIRLVISDTGPGIPEEEQPQIWERFYRVDKARSRSEGGIGLGLSIVRSIVQAHGGQVGVESMPGKGSAFYLTLPLSKTVSND